MSVTIRPMTEADLPAVSALAGRLVRLHHDFDPRRFLYLPHPEPGYARYFASELKGRAAVLLVAVEAETESIIGYAYGRLEPRSYNDLLDAHGKLHDVFVDERGRRLGTGEVLVRAMVAALEARGAPRVLLATAIQNEAAQRLFEKVGFATTMLEMTRERT